MKVQSIALRDTHQFPSLLLDYLDQQEHLKAYYHHFPTLDNFHSLIQEKASFKQEYRDVLVEVLQDQYAGYADKPDLLALQDAKTFTVTTGHQLNIFGGPLYIVYKIATIINLARELQARYPDYRFVPVYWMATEDHDFAEIASVTLNDQKITWNTTSTGPVGKLNPQSLLAQLPAGTEVLPIFLKAYGANTSLSDAVRCYMHHLFGHEGLVCLDADDRRLKHLFKPVIADELLRMSSGALVDKTTLELREKGYSLPVNSREINLFYMTDDLRARIVKESDDLYTVVDTTICFTKSEILAELEAFPERFSPNVVLRPLYEEYILPNLAYIGGPSEVPYWLQLKSVFDYHSTMFPALIPRKFGLYIPIAYQKKLDKLHLQPKDLFSDPVQLKKDLVKKLSTNNLSLEAEKAAYQQLFEAILLRTKAIDPSLCATVSAEAKGLLDSLIRLEKKLLKAEEKKHQTSIQQLTSLLELSFPQGVAQERKTNFQAFYLTNRKFITELLEVFNALDFSYEILLEDNVYNERRLAETLPK